jgi:hypothetical protein
MMRSPNYAPSSPIGASGCRILTRFSSRPVSLPTHSSC